jgi:hypothetical protein
VTEVAADVRSLVDRGLLQVPPSQIPVPELLVLSA